MMIVTGVSLSRRTVLRGLGSAIALPLLDSMIPAFAASPSAAAPVARLAAIYVPMGANMSKWTPAAVGALELTPILQPLAAFKDRLVVVSGLDSREAEGNDGGTHPKAQATWATGARAKRTEGVDIRAGISMDQIAARAFEEETQLSSLELALESVDTFAGGCELGYSCAYNGTIAWRTPTTPLPMEPNPRLVFERLFGTSETTDAGARVARSRRGRSILDAVTEKIGGLQKRVGPADRNKLDQFLEAVRDVERRLQKIEAQSDRELPLVEQPAGIPATFEEHAKLMFALQTLAYQTDLTRVTTMMMGREASARSFPEIGIPDTWHPLSHHAGDPVKLEKQAKLNTFHVGLLAYLLDKLQSTPDGDGSLLDHTTLLYGSGMSDSDLHLPAELPTLVVPSQGSGITGGRHVKYDGQVPLANLQLSLLQSLGMSIQQFGDSTGALSGL